MAFRKQKLAARREALGMSLADLHCAVVRAGINVTLESLRALEHGRVQNPAGRTLLALAEALGVDASWFYTDESSPDRGESTPAG